MDLILWRHAEAADGTPDLERELTRTGHRQARDMAKWLRKRLPANARVISSPARRAMQTAHALSKNAEIVAEIAPGASFGTLMAAAGWPGGSGTIVLVGHQPELGQAAAKLLTNSARTWSIRKGAIWWFTCRAGNKQVALRAVMSPDFLA